MKRVILSAVALMMAVAVQAAGVADGATMRIKLDEKESSEMPANCKLMPKAQLGEVEQDAELGYVRTFKGGRNGIMTNDAMTLKGGARTIAFWIKTDKSYQHPKNPDQQVVQKNAQLFSTGKRSEEEGVSAVFSAVLLNGKALRVNTGRTDQFVIFNCPATFFDAWRHVAITVGKESNGKSIKLYIDGEEVAPGKYQGPKESPEDDFTLTTAETPLSIGMKLFGAMSEVAIFDSELSAGDVAKLMKETK